MSDKPIPHEDYEPAYNFGDEAPSELAPATGSTLRRVLINVIADITACVFTEHDAREKIAAELRRIADVVEEGDTFGESGTMTHADYGHWKIIGLPDE